MVDKTFVQLGSINLSFYETNESNMTIRSQKTNRVQYDQLGFNYTIRSNRTIGSYRRLVVMNLLGSLGPVGHARDDSLFDSMLVVQSILGYVDESSSWRESQNITYD